MVVSTRSYGDKYRDFRGADAEVSGSWSKEGRGQMVGDKQKKVMLWVYKRAVAMYIYSRVG